MAYSLILSSDTLDLGRQKINAFMQSSAGIWSSDTPNYSIISLQGANSNTATGNYSFVTGKNNSALTSNYQTIGGGYKNRVQSVGNTIGGGSNNRIYNYSEYSTIAGGKSNVINNAYRSFIGGGWDNSINSGYLSVIAGGGHNKAYSLYSSVLGGTFNSSVGVYSAIVNGRSNIISGTSPFISNRDIIINGGNNIISGTSISNTNTIANGYNNIIKNGQSNFVVGKDCTVNTKGYQFLFGSKISSPNSYEMALGKIGRKIRLRFDAFPNAYLTSGTWQTSGADYAEYFEWNDGNQSSEERYGYFVELESGKIQKALNKQPIGIVSAGSAFVGDSSQDYWSKIYLKDEWGKTINKKYEVYAFKTKSIDNDKIEKKVEIYFSKEDNAAYSELPNMNKPKGTITTAYNKTNGLFIREIEESVFNPDYVPGKEYIPRKDRKEWNVIGLIGKLRVRTSENITGQYVDVDKNNAMAKNGTTYPVLEKIKDFDGNYGIVTIFFK